MNKFPTPPPDRRLEVKKTTYNKTDTDPNRTEEGNYGKEDAQNYNNLNLLRIKHIEDMRKNILSYKVRKSILYRYYVIKKCFYQIKIK